MKKTIRGLAIGLVFVGLSACSISPGIPGLKTNLSKNDGALKGVNNYKLIIINADTIREQKAFDYSGYIKNRKMKNDLYQSKTSVGENEKSVGNSSELKNRNDASLQVNSIGEGGDKGGLSNESSVPNVRLFEGVTSQDNKANYQYYVGKGDVLNITVWDHPELTVPSENNAFGGHIVGSDGSFHFPYSGKITALGKTIRNIRDELERKLQSFITKPQVSVSIANYRSQKVYTSGALAKPVTLMIDDTPMTVRDAISESGGVVANKYTGYATLTRGGKNILIDLNRMLKFNDNRQNFILGQGDRLNVVERKELDEFNRKLNLDVRKENVLSSVRIRNEIKSLRALNPINLKFELEKERSIARIKNQLERELRSEQAKVFVMGEVHDPGSVKYQVENGMTLAEAINDAGSFKEESVNPSGIFVIRKEGSADDIPTVYQLPISSVENIFFAEQFDIRPRDIIYVTAMSSIRWNRVLTQLLPSLALVNTYRNFN